MKLSQVSPQQHLPSVHRGPTYVSFTQLPEDITQNLTTFSLTSPKQQVKIETTVVDKSNDWQLEKSSFRGSKNNI